MPESRYQLAVDIGGTFVDAMELDLQTLEVRFEKSSTTPSKPWLGVVNAIEALGTDLSRVDLFTHGTTLGLNAVLERRGAVTGIITNEGMRDIFLLGRGNVPPESMYDFSYDRPPSLVERRNTAGVRGRLNYRGDEIQPLDEDDVLTAAQTLLEGGAESIAVCYLHSYRNPDHEIRTAEIVRANFPDVKVSISTEIAPEYREYERMATTVLDAYIRPIFERYVTVLHDELRNRGFHGTFLIMRSGGGSMTVAAAQKSPTNTVLSGPAGGIVGGCTVAQLLGNDHVLTCDVGGTSLDACVIESGQAASAFEAELENYPLLIPTYDIRTIGAGGGSIAWLDNGLLKVGPRSAGADPGPVCYGRGGTDPTVTDAAVALGYIDPDSFMSGQMELKVDDAIEAIRKNIAEPMDIEPVVAAAGIFDVLIAKTVGAVRQITVERGHDPQDFSLMAFGGAGPLIATALASEIGMKGVIVPLDPSGFSARGMLGADLMHDVSRTLMVRLDDLPPTDLARTFNDLAEEAAAALVAQGVSPTDVVIEQRAELRYVGQEHTLPVIVTTEIDLEATRNDFGALHELRYGHSMENALEVVNVRVRGVGRQARPAHPASEQGDNQPNRAQTGSREAYDFVTRRMTGFTVYDRDRLIAGDHFDGPALIDEGTSTTVVYTGQHVEVESHGFLIITLNSKENQ